MSAVTFREMIGQDMHIGEHPDALPPVHSAEPLRMMRKVYAREIAYSRIAWIYHEYLQEFPQSKFVEILYARYGVHALHLMTIEQLDNLVSFFRSVLMTIPRRFV
jgi:hypothetical protein